MRNYKTSNYCKRHYYDMGKWLTDMYIMCVIDKKQYNCLLLSLVNKFYCDNSNFKPEFFKDYCSKLITEKENKS